jgi:uncharacterized radical SAM protein YgiQ
MTRRELDQRGWDHCDIILVTGDAYVDHPAFGVALLGRWLEDHGHRVGVIAAPDPNDVEAFRVLGAPRLFWGVTAGNLDSQLARLTVMRKRRRDDPYLPEGLQDRRTPNATIVYVTKVRQAFKVRMQDGGSSIQHPESRLTPHASPLTSSPPVIIGGLEASLRRFPYYDYWTDGVKRSILFDSKADLLVYGMAEQAIVEIAGRLHRGEALSGIRGTAEIRPKTADFRPATADRKLELPAYEVVAADKTAFAAMTRAIFENLASEAPATMVQPHGDRELVVHPPAPPLAPAALDALYALPFTRRPHPAYGKARIAAYDMIRDSITTHRGCYGACAFCAIAAHQGKRVVSRSHDGVLAEVRRIAADPEFRGTLSDLGGPTANMYGTRCRRDGRGCRRPSCLTPDLCAHLEADAGPVLSLLRAARAVPRVNHVFVSSGIRFDLALAQEPRGYIGELAARHVSGRLKIAPEHIAANVLRRMRKPGAKAYQAFRQRFIEAARAAGKPQPLVEYFISGHPGCTLADMIELALYLKRENIRPEQVQDFYPAPLTLAAAMFHTGLDPLTGEPVYVAKTDTEKAMQRALLLCHDPAFHRKAREALKTAGREDLIGRGPECLIPPEGRTPGPRASPR